ncbi:MAG: dienelactone hydrolase family protein [Dehalococcoidia bacterium]|jgi:carboxymethylenebutenolidase|tara:strand:- start:270 stop:1025 length:756 start_codon:yes stop_codon:yes gene_type:complete
MYTTDMYEGMIAETITMTGHGGAEINAYLAKPIGDGPFPGVVLIHHLPGWDELYREFARRFAHHGYQAICPNLYFRDGHGTPEDVAAKVRSVGGVADDQVMGDLESAANYLKQLSDNNGKTAVFGTCSGGRHGFLAGCRLDVFDAVVECWGGNVVMDSDSLTEKQPVSPSDYTADLAAPLLGIFGNDDQSPTPDKVNIHEDQLKTAGKEYEFHRYDGAGHGFFYHDRPMYRQEQAVDGWNKIWDFLGRKIN